MTSKADKVFESMSGRCTVCNELLWQTHHWHKKDNDDWYVHKEWVCPDCKLREFNAQHPESRRRR